MPCKRGQNHPSCYSAPLGTTPQPGQNVRIRAYQLLTVRSFTRASPLIQHSNFCSAFATETAPSARFPAVSETNQRQPAGENIPAGLRPGLPPPAPGVGATSSIISQRVPAPGAWAWVASNLLLQSRIRQLNWTAGSSGVCVCVCVCVRMCVCVCV